MGLRWWWQRKVHGAGRPQKAQVSFEAVRSIPQVAWLLAKSRTLLDLLRDATQSLLRKEGVKRGLLFGLASFLLLAALVFLLNSHNTFSPAETIVVSVLVLMSVVAMLVMDLSESG